MPWQAHVALVGGELIEGERGMVPAFREFGITVPRQQGKTILVLAWMLQRALMWHTPPQKIVYTAQTGAAARKKFKDDYMPLMKRSPFNPGVSRYYRAAENTGVLFVNDSQIDVWNTAESAGHGQTIGLGIMDEIFADLEPHREQAMGPAMSTVADAQRLWTSTAGTDTSPVYEAKVESGRAAVDNGLLEGIGYVEYSAHPDEDPTDPRTWEACMPALGRTVSIRSIANELEIMAPIVDGRREPEKLAEFARAYCNIPNNAAGVRVIPKEAWDKVHVDTAAAQGGIVFSVDVNAHRTAATIVAAGANRQAELVEHRPGTGWAKEWLLTKAKEHRARVAIDPYGPAGSFIQDLEEAQIEVVSFTAQRYAQACGALYDDILEQRIQVRRHELFDIAVNGAAKRPLGDSWAWSRKNSQTDISPLVALTLAADVPRMEPKPVNVAIF